MTVKQLVPKSGFLNRFFAMTVKQLVPKNGFLTRFFVMNRLLNNDLTMLLNISHQCLRLFFRL